MKASSVEDRFWAKVDAGGPDECWLWNAATDAKGYGRFGFQGKNRRASRLAWELTNGPVPTGPGYHGLCVCHRCDNPPCCNPAHLFLGTNADNVADMLSKGRGRWLSLRGERHGSARLSNRTAAEIKRCLAEGDQTQKEIASRFGVAQSTVSRVATGFCWGHVL